MQDLIELVKQYALETRGPDEPPFVLSSGQTSRFYLDCRKLSLHSKGLFAIVDTIWHKLRELKIGDIEAIGGPSVGADPIVGGLLYRCGYCNANAYAIKHDIRGFLVRKQEKEHGKTGRIIGSLKPGDKCLFVEDVTTTGKSSLDAIDAVQAYGAKIELAISVIDRMAGASEAFAERKIPFYPLLNLHDLGL